MYKPYNTHTHGTGLSRDAIRFILDEAFTIPERERERLTGLVSNLSVGVSYFSFHSFWKAGAAGWGWGSHSDSAGWVQGKAV